MRMHFDDRGSRYCDIFPDIGKGDINVTVVQPGATALWHRHEFQDDYQFVVKGALKIGMCNGPTWTNPRDYMDLKVHIYRSWPEKYKQITLNRLYQYHDADDQEDRDTIKLRWTDETKVEWHVLSDRMAHTGPLFIPRGLWHGCHNFTNEEAILIYHISDKYNPDDEDRCDPEVMGWEFRQEAK